MLQRGDGANAAQGFLPRDGELVGGDQVSDDELVIVAGLDVGFVDLVGFQGFDTFLLVGKNIRLLRIIHVVINHAPDRDVAGAGECRNGFDGVLSIDDVIGAITATDLDKIDLAKVEMFRQLLNMRGREVSLIVLAGHQIFDRDKFKVHFWDILIKFLFFHFHRIAP